MSNRTETRLGPRTRAVALPFIAAIGMAVMAGEAAWAKEMPVASASVPATIDALADAYQRLKERAPGDDSLPLNTLAALKAEQRKEDMLRQRFASIAMPTDGQERITYDMLKETLDADHGTRVCHLEYWSVDHISGWHIRLPELALRQPVGSAAARRNALRRWTSFPAYVATEIAKLKIGLSRGYSVPRPVADRVIHELDVALAEPVDRMPYFSPAMRDRDPAFKARFRRLVLQQIRPALTRYRSFLANQYLPHARQTIGITALPDGRACYKALLRKETTLSITPEQVYQGGQSLIVSNQAAIAAMGYKLFGERDIAVITRKAETAPDNRFSSAAEALAFARAFVARARVRSEPLFQQLPDAELVVRPFPATQSGSGMSPYYEPPKAPTEPALYMVNPETWRDQTKGFAEVVAAHEGWPGHHLQVTIARLLPQTSAFRKQAIYSAYVEGWARYVERLADEADIYDSPYARIAWRSKPGFGMVVDPGLHWFGWTRPRAAEFLKSSGLFPTDQSVEDMIDRISVMPAQLTSYDTGGLEFLKLRDEARRRLGARFSLPRFHTALLSIGIVPLDTLDRHMSQWLDEEAKSTN